MIWEFLTRHRHIPWQPEFAAWWPMHTTSAQRQSLLRLIAVAAEEHLPLSPLIAAWAEDERGVQRRRLRRLARLLKSGTPLPEAVEQVPGVLRDEDLLAIRFGAQSGTLTASVRALLDESPPEASDVARTFRSTLVYVAAVILLSLPVVAFFQISIAPQMHQIFAEYSLETPWALQWLEWLTGLVAKFWWLFALAALALIWPVFSARPGRYVRHTLLGRFVRPLRELRVADVLHKLSIALQAGRPIPGVLSTLARYHFDPAIRHKLLFVRNEVEQGADVWQSMASVDFLTEKEVNVVATSERIGNRPWILRQLAAGKRRRTSRLLARLSELVLPAVAMVIGAIVLLQALAVFQHF
jgi:type IV pilus assembly protein PilC